MYVIGSSKNNHHNDHKAENTTSYDSSLTKDVIDSRTTIRCSHCDILLSGKDQFIGHMIHNHELQYEAIKSLWTNLSLSTFISLHSA
jgi:hypothetical protein